MLDVGLIGAGREWDERYRPALAGLKHRMRVRAVHSSVETVAAQLAAEWRCDIAGGLLALMQRSDVRALLILDTAWYGGIPAQFACRAGKPAFLAGRLGEWVARAPEIVPLALESGTSLMPDFRHRYSPSTSRLKELLATSLGRPDRIAVQLRAGTALAGLCEAARGDQPEGDALLAALDWVCHLVGTAPASISATAACGGQQLSIAFQRSAAGGAPATARVAAAPDQADAARFTAEIHCRKGIARIHSNTEIEWETSAERRRESLAGERADVEVMLDHFSRRVVGGLIPVPTLDDLAIAARLACAATQSLASAGTIRLDASPAPKG